MICSATRHLGYATLLVLVLVATGLTACGDTADPKPRAVLGCAEGSVGNDVAVVLGARANSPAPLPLDPQSQRLLTGAARESSQISLIAVDGGPRVAEPLIFRPTAKNQVAIDQQFQKFSQVVDRQLRQLRAAAPEADPLTALQRAADSVQTGGSVIFADSGVQTIAPLDFRTEGLLQAAPDEVVEYLRAGGRLPRLSGKTVVMVGVGDTAAPQSRFDQPVRDNLRAIWTAVATAGGSGCVRVVAEPNTRDAVAGAPAVSTVTAPKPGNPEFKCGDNVLPDTGSVGFQPGLDTLRDPAAAEQTLRSLVTQMAGRGHTAHLVGTTASWGTEAYRIDLSRRRADRVKQVLVRLGARGDAITTEGVGTHWPTHVVDLAANGSLLPGPAQQNRSVIVQLRCSTS